MKIQTYISLPKTTSKMELLGTVARRLKSKGLAHYADIIIHLSREVETTTEVVEIIKKFVNVRNNN